MPFGGKRIKPRWQLSNTALKALEIWLYVFLWAVGMSREEGKEDGWDDKEGFAPTREPTRA